MFRFRRVLPVAFVLMLTSCGGAQDAVGTAPASSAGTVLRSAAGSSVAPARPVLPPVGPFRHTGRDGFQSSVTPVTAARLGSSWRPGCPVPPSALRLLSVTSWGFDGRTHRGALVVNADVAGAVVGVFREMYDARFPVARVGTVEAYGSDDDRVMAANVTSAFNCRRVAGTATWSEHAYGRAIDINPIQNPYVRGSSVDPPAGRAYVDRGNVRPGMVVAGDPVVRAFTAVGWGWGGNFRTSKDYQHFSRSGR